MNKEQLRRLPNTSIPDLAEEAEDIIDIGRTYSNERD